MEDSVSQPSIWLSTTKFRLFVSHLVIHKDKAIRLRECLDDYAISAFVAHEDIEPTRAWQDEIERALHNMDAFLAIHTVGFKESSWTQQEIGFALARGVKIISLKMGEDPTGFIGKRQALPRQRRTAPQVAREVDKMLLSDDLASERLLHAKEKNPTFISPADREMWTQFFRNRYTQRVPSRGGR